MQMIAENRPLFSYYLQEFERFDENGQPILSSLDFIDKSALPRLNAGFSLDVTYKAWNFSAYLYGQSGHYIYNNTRNAYFTAGAIANARNVTVDVLSSGEAGSAEAAPSTRFLEKGDFIRLQSATIGYSVPLPETSFIQKLHISV